MQDITPQTGHSDCTTNGIRVQVAATYLTEHSKPELGRFHFAYQVRLKNVGDRTATLRSRKWIIRNADNEERVVEGPGVIGEYPRLAPNERYDYMSGSPMDTSWGTMEGYFVWEDEDGSLFKTPIGRFFLASNTAPISDLEYS
ncbi:MAG: Co2+/Mg2+ efflux protein ApaG [Planctomycetota bacterium]|nr:Co2+/Mg2+ efflux protein ApaG [Planctomycetota bacterium]MDA1114584.1 Co2+/Mg2+ efflux protein ApaG [Planctomycetota bacterium]